MSFEPLDEVYNVFEEIEEHVLARANSLRRPDDSSIPSLCFGSLLPLYFFLRALGCHFWRDSIDMHKKTY